MPSSTAKRCCVIDEAMKRQTHLLSSVPSLFMDRRAQPRHSREWQRVLVGATSYGNKKYYFVIGPYRAPQLCCCGGSCCLFFYFFLFFWQQGDSFLRIHSQVIRVRRLLRVEKGPDRCCLTTSYTILKRIRFLMLSVLSCEVCLLFCPQRSFAILIYILVFF